MNIPDGRAFFCNWMVSREGPQFLPLQTITPPDGRPERLSRVVVQGKDLDPAAIEASLADCPLSDAVLDLQQAPLGELVGHGPQPSEVVDLVRQRSAATPTAPMCGSCGMESSVCRIVNAGSVGER